MIRLFEKFLTSRKAALVMMLLYAFLMAAATVLEEMTDTATAKALIYHSPLFFLLDALMVANFIGVTKHLHLFRVRKWGYVLIHGAFIVILTGAAITHFFSRDGMMAIREGERTREMVVGNRQNRHTETLPFEVELTDFRLIRYPGSSSPSSYESDLRIHDQGKVMEEKVYMNHVLDYRGYRFFQSSYDPDETGTILSVSYDSAGRTVTYIGYALLLLGLLGALFGKDGRFRKLVRQLDKTAAFLLLLTLPLTAAQKLEAAEQATALRPSMLPQEVVADFGKLAMQSPQGRIVPVNTFALDLLHKLQVEELPAGMDANRFLLGLLTEPSRWASYPLVKVDDPELRRTLADGQDFISYISAFDQNGDYRFQAQVETAYHRNPAERSLSDKELLKVDERLNILHLLFEGQMVNVVPPLRADDSWTSHHPYYEEYLSTIILASHSGQRDLASAALERLRALQLERFPELEKMQSHLDKEVVYNELDLLKHSRRIYLICGGLLLVLTISAWFRKKEKRLLKWTGIALMAAIAVGLLLHAANMGLRWYISGHVPLSNSYETMVLLAWTTVISGACFLKKSQVSAALATIFAGVILFVSELNWMDPQITPLVPVLKSPWLMFHVAFMMISYGFLGIGAVLGIINLILLAVRPSGEKKALLEAQVRRLSVILEMSLMLGLSFMLAGIFLGAVWANESWGTYWNWDPKETWALITAVLYAVLLHWRWFSKRKNDLWFSILSQWAILAVLMTYFGVNYLLSGMHSYGDTTLFNDFPLWIFAVAFLVFCLPGAAALFRAGSSRRR